MNLILYFAILNILNVIIQTVKSIVTIKCDKIAAAVVNAVAYGLYTVYLVAVNMEFPLWTKVVVTAGANLVGVFIVKWIEEKKRKDKLWKIEVTIPTVHTKAVDFDLKSVPHSYIIISPKYTLFNFYCDTQKESQKVKDIVKQYDAKYFAAESKIL